MSGKMALLSAASVVCEVHGVVAQWHIRAWVAYQTVCKNAARRQCRIRKRMALWHSGTGLSGAYQDRLPSCLPSMLCEEVRGAVAELHSCMWGTASWQAASLSAASVA